MKDDNDIEKKLEAASAAVTAQEEEKSTRRNLKGRPAKVIAVIAVCFSLFQLITGYYPLIAMYQRLIHVIFGFSLIFLIFPLSAKQRKDRLSWDGYLLVGLLLYISYYVVTHFIARADQVGLEPPLYELVLGGILILLTLEASRRTTGWSLAIFCVGSLIYALFGEWLPDVLGHPNYSIERIVSGLFMTTEGIYGIIGNRRHFYLSLCSFRNLHAGIRCRLFFLRLGLEPLWPCSWRPGQNRGRSQLPVWDDFRQRHCKRRNNQGRN